MRKLSNKMTMVWVQCIVWIITILCTIILNRDVATLSIVSGVFVATNSWLFKLRAEEKKGEQDNGSTPSN